MFKSKEEKLLAAAKAGKTQDAIALLKGKPNLSYQDKPERMTALHWAAMRGDTVLIKALINYGADINAVNYYAATPLLLACDRNHTVDALALISAGANVSLPQYTYTSALHLAAQNGNYEVTRALLAAGADIEAQTKDGITPLMIAIDRKKARVAELLMTEGAVLPAQCPSRSKLAGIAKQLGLPVDLPATPAPATAAPTLAPANTAQAVAGWHKLDDEKIALIEEFAPLSRKLTTIFNFATRERLVITQNLTTQQETMAAPENFSAVPPAVLEQACSAFEACGGKVDRNATLGLFSKSKPA